MAVSSIKFDIPDKCRTFTPFPRLPPEIRHKIWKTALSTPGMNFVKLESRGRSWRWLSLGRALLPNPDQHTTSTSNDIDELVKHEVQPSQMWDTHLVPLAPTKQSDMSNFRSLNKEMLTLSLTCVEARQIVKNMAAKKGTLRLGNGQIVSLADSSDVVFIEYFPHELFGSGCNFGIEPNCPDLGQIRRVAVRFCYTWQDKKVPSRCIICGQLHESTNGVVYPVHLYQFLARHLPNLEEFYFVDYFILRKAKGIDKGEQPIQGDNNGEQPLKLRCGNRTFHTANEQDWNIKPQVMQLQDWLQDRFVRYAKASQLSRHKSPEKVRFGILACEWSISPPPSYYKSALTTTVNKGRNKRVIYEDHSLLESRRQALRRKSQKDAQIEPRQVDSTVPFVFGNWVKNAFTFTFRMNVN